MQLPEVLKMRRLLNDVPSGRGPALLGTVVHNRHPRIDPENKSGAAALVPAMMGNDVDIHFAELVDWAHQFHFLVPSQIAKVQDCQLAKSDECSQGAQVLRLVRWELRGILTSGIVFSP